MTLKTGKWVRRGCFSVALHKAGHAFGLAHSDDPSAVMYPQIATGLTSDDIAAIQAPYGSRGNTGSSTCPNAHSYAATYAVSL